MDTIEIIYKKRKFIKTYVLNFDPETYSFNKANELNNIRYHAKNKTGHTCNVCLQKNNLVLFSKLFKYNKKLKWFEKSIISILKKESINYNIVFVIPVFIFLYLVKLNLIYYILWKHQK